jgi:ATP-dependent exoDNAse (exonuclease V) beta subunit
MLGPLLETALGQAMSSQDMRGRGITSKEGGTKPTFLPEAGSNDPVAHSVAENLFWNEQMMEHAKFFIMLMPGPELAGPRGQAERFQQTFAGQLEKARAAGLDRANYVAFNRSTVELVKPYADFKHKMRDEQAAGRLQSLVWPSFFEHTEREAEHFVKRLEQFSRGDTSIDMKETAEFWTLIMGEHAGFIAHLLDPEENALIQKAMQTSDAFRRMHKSVPTSKGPVEQAVDDIIDFKTAAERGIQTGKIKSIINPALADHVRREALKAADELKRAA